VQVAARGPRAVRCTRHSPRWPKVYTQRRNRLAPVGAQKRRCNQPLLHHVERDSLFRSGHKYILDIVPTERRNNYICCGPAIAGREIYKRHSQRSASLIFQEWTKSFNSRADARRSQGKNVIAGSDAGTDLCRLAPNGEHLYFIALRKRKSSSCIDRRARAIFCSRRGRKNVLAPWAGVHAPRAIS